MKLTLKRIQDELTAHSFFSVFIMEAFAHEKGRKLAEVVAANGGCEIV